MKWKFTNIHHSFRKQAGISLNEYALLDVIYKTQTHPETTVDGWANISYSEIGDFLGLSKGAVAGIIERCVSIKLIEVNSKSNRLKKTTPLWYSNAYIDDDDETKNGADFLIVQKMNVQKVNDIVQKMNVDRSESERHTLVSKEKRKKENNGGHPSLFDETQPGGAVISDWPTDDPIEEVIMYLNQAAQRKFAAAGPGSAANRKFVSDLFKNGKEKITKQDIFDVIDLKCWQWLNSAKMKPHLQPSTLFAKSNFLKYLGEVVEWRANPNSKSDMLRSMKKSEMTPQAMEAMEHEKLMMEFEKTREAVIGLHDD